MEIIPKTILDLTSKVPTRLPHRLHVAINVGEYTCARWRTSTVTARSPGFRLELAFGRYSTASFEIHGDRGPPFQDSTGLKYPRKTDSSNFVRNTSISMRPFSAVELFDL